MNPFYVYYEFIKSKLLRQNFGFCTCSRYLWEKHHIIPRFLGGKDNVQNLVILSVEEHALAHYYLFLCLLFVYEENPTKEKNYKLMIKAKSGWQRFDFLD